MNARAACLREEENASCWKSSSRHGQESQRSKRSTYPQYGSISLAEFPFGLVYRLPRRRDEQLMQTDEDKLEQQKSF